MIAISMPSGETSNFLQKRSCVYIDDSEVNIAGCSMALQIANSVVVEKVERLARAMGMTKTAVVERAIDRLAGETQAGPDAGRIEALLAQLDLIPDRQDAFDPLAWDEQGLPR